MRPLEELLAEARKAESEYAARKAAKEKAYQEAKQEQAIASERAAAAAAAGNMDAYTKARQAEQFAHDRADAMWFAKEEPYFTKEENDSFVDEVNKASRRTTVELLKRFRELYDEWLSVVEQFKKTSGMIFQIQNSLRKTLPPVNKRQNLPKYKEVMTRNVPPRFDFSPATKAGIEAEFHNYYPEGEKRNV